MTIPDVPLPPWARKIQQAWAFQVLFWPILLGFGSAVLIQGCLANGIENISRACLMGALNSTLVSFLTVIFSGHSPGSSDFKADGTPTAAPVLKELDDNVLLVKAKAADPTSSLTTVDAVHAENAVKQAAQSVIINNAMVKDALASEAKPEEQ